MTLRTTIILGLLMTNIASTAKDSPFQTLEELEVTKQRFATVEVLTDHGRFDYHLDNTGERDVSAALQAIFDRTAKLKDTSATFTFLPGIYFIDKIVN
jgi:hypothetical protein